MGVNDSKAALDEVESEIKATPQGHGIKLYKFITTGSGSGGWELVTGNARPSFYDALEDTSQSGSKHDWFMEIDGSDVDLHIDQAAGIILDPSNKRLTFNAASSVYAMRISSDELFKSFTTELNNKLFYNTFQIENDEAGRSKLLGQDFADRLFNFDSRIKAEPMDVDDDHEVYHTPEKYSERNAIQEDEEEDAILGVIMGATDNSYLMKGGGKFDVLRNVVGGVEDKSISFALTPSQGSSFRGSRTTPGGALFTPSRVLLTGGERRMHLLDGDNPNSLHHADVETGKIINTFSFSKDNVEVPIKEIAHDNKSAQLDETSTFLGLDNNRLARWDLRDPRGVVQQSPLVTYQDGKDYSRGTNFSCMATSGEGYVVVGAQDGQIRLYSSKSLTRANTSVPGMGAPITSVDVTFDGKWIVATTDHYLMVVKTTFTTDKGAPSNGFTSRMGSRGSMPRLLRLRPEDVARTGKGKFKAAKFSWVTEQGQAERYIVASCGKFSVIWNLSKIKSSTSEMVSFGGFPTNMDYVMTAKEEEVVDAAFQHRKFAPEDSSIVVATQHSLFNIGGVN